MPLHQSRFPLPQGYGVHGSDSLIEMAVIQAPRQLFVGGLDGIRRYPGRRTSRLVD
jgi:hypothetical protein